MAEWHKQDPELKDCFFWSKNATKGIVILQTASREHAVKKTELYKWLSLLEKSEVFIEVQDRFRTSFNAERICDPFF